MIKNGRPIRVRSGRFRQAFRLWPVLIALVPVLAGCGTLSDIRAEQRAEALARKYGERLPESELGPFKGFTRDEYSQYKCRTEAGEFIYTTVENVESVFQMRPRDSRELYTRLRARDIPEDPWGHTNTDAEKPWSPFMRDYAFFETRKAPGKRERTRWNRHMFRDPPQFGDGEFWEYSLGEPDGRRYRYRKKDEKFFRPLVAKNIPRIRSRYGYTWREVRDKYDRHFGVWGGELIVKDLKTHRVLGVRRGFYDVNFRSCPKGKDVFWTFEFVSKVLIPKGGATQWRLQHESD